MLFVAIWRDRVSMLVDALDAPDAMNMAADAAGGEGPSGVLPLAPRTFAAEIVWEPVPAEEDDADDEGEEELRLLPMPHVAELLEALDDADPARLEAGTAETQPAPLLNVCTSEADADDGSTYRCTRLAGHAPPCEAEDAAGNLLRWES